jgi:hypothetical protein
MHRGLLTRDQVPEPPDDAEQWDGSRGGTQRPYENGGYVKDSGDERWRYDRDGLKTYIRYGRRRLWLAGDLDWVAWWHRK